MSGRLNRRTFVWSALGMLVVPLRAFASEPPFALVRKRLAKRDSEACSLRVTRLGQKLAEWNGEARFPSPKTSLTSSVHGSLEIVPTSNQPGLALLASLLAPDPIRALEKRFGSIRSDRSRIEVLDDHFAYRYGTSPSVLVERESWELLDARVKVDSSELEAKVDDYRGSRRIRILIDGRPRWTALIKTTS